MHELHASELAVLHLAQRTVLSQLKFKVFQAESEQIYLPQIPLRIFDKKFQNRKKQIFYATWPGEWWNLFPVINFVQK